MINLLVGGVMQSSIRVIALSIKADTIESSFDAGSNGKDVRARKETESVHK